MIGIPTTFATTRVIASQLYGVSPADPRYAAAAPLVLFTTLGAAGYLPSRRASLIDPLRALRHE